MADFYLQPVFGEGQTPGVQIPQNCIDFVNSRGGFENLTAEEAIAFQRECSIPPVDFGSASYPEDSLPPGLGGVSEPVSVDERPLWTNVEPENPAAGGSAVQSALEDSMAGVNWGAVTGDFENGLMSSIPMDTGLWAGFGAQTGGQNQGIDLPQIFDLPGAIQQGANALADLLGGGQTPTFIAGNSKSCFSRKVSKRRRIKLVRGADGQLHPVIYCAKPQMNPLNAHALRRSAVRLARFHAISKGIEKLIQKACKGSSRSRRMPANCFPRKKGCR